MKIKFFVPTKPAPGGSKKSFVSATTGKIVTLDDCDENEAWRGVVATFGRQAHAGKPLLDGALLVTMVFYRTRPKGHYGTGKNAGTLKPSAPRFPTTKPDVLKLARSTEDALTGVIWVDDSATVDLILSKRYADRPCDRPGVEIEIRTW